MSCDIPEHYDPIDTARLTYLDLSFDKLKLLHSNLDEKNYLRLPHDSIANGALPP